MEYAEMDGVASIDVAGQMELPFGSENHSRACSHCAPIGFLKAGYS